MAKDVAVSNPNGLPAHLVGKEKTTRIGNIDRSDLIIPRVKLLQAISPEIDTFENAKAGNFWHTVASEMMGNQLIGVPVIMKKTQVLWSPRGDDRGILARSNDGVHWDLPAGTEFTIKPKNSPTPVTYKLGETVTDRVDGLPALTEFGSSIPGDKNSPPAAALTYTFLWYFPEFMSFSPAIIINTRGAVKAGKALINTIDMSPVDHWNLQYQIGITKEKFEDGFYYNYKYAPSGYAEEKVAERAHELYDYYIQHEFRASDEHEEEQPVGGGGQFTGKAKGTVGGDANEF